MNAASINTAPLWPNLNSSQLLAGEAILNSVMGIEENNCFYIDGPGGSGKPYLYTALIQKLEEMNKNFLFVLL